MNLVLLDLIVMGINPNPLLLHLDIGIRNIRDSIQDTHTCQYNSTT